MAVQINVAANQAALTASIQAGVQAYNQRFAQNNQINLSINQRAFSQPLGRITGDVKDFEAALAASNARVIAFGASTAVLGGVIRSFKELANVTIEVEKNLADINRVFGLTTSQLQKFSTDLFNVTKLTASSFDDASKAALEFSRQGLKAEETLQRTKDALTLTRLAGISTANAVDALTSTVNGFAATGISTTQILNKLVAVEQDYAVGAGDLAEALSRTGQAAQEAGVSLDQLNALVTSAQQSTARGGAVIGNALKTIFTRLQRTDTLDQLEAFDIAVRDIQGNILPAVQILQNFAGAYKGLADAQRAQLSEQVAGVYQVNILKAIVNDLNKSQSTYAGALQRGASATNEAEVATAKLNQTLDALLKQTATSTQQLANNIGKVTFEPLAKYGTEQLKSFIESINEVLEGEGVGSTFANGLLKGIRNVIAGPGAIAAFFTLFKLIQNSFTYLSEALPQIAGITTETQNRKNIEASILQIMAQQGTVAQALDGLTGNQAAQAQLLLQTARAQTAEYQKQAALAKQLAAQLSGQGVKVAGSRGLQVTRSGGYIPKATKMAEVVGAQAGGYAPGRVVSSPVGGVMNTAEDVKYIPGFAQPFINPPANSKAGRAHRQKAISRTGVDPYMYSGFIPNFAYKNFGFKNDLLNLDKQTIQDFSYPAYFENKNLADGGLDKNRKVNNIYDSVSGTVQRIRYTSKDRLDKKSRIYFNDYLNNAPIPPIVKDSYDRAFDKLKQSGFYAGLQEKDIKSQMLDKFKKKNNGDYWNFRGALYESLVAKKLGNNFQLSTSQYSRSDILPINQQGASLFTGVESKSGGTGGNWKILQKAIETAVQQKQTQFNDDGYDDIDIGRYALYQTYNKGFIPNFAPPTSAIRIPWFKKFGNPAFDAIQPALGISKASDTETFRQINFKSTAEGADERGDSNIFAPLYEDFAFKAMQLVSQPNVKNDLIRGYVLQPGTNQKQAALDAGLKEFGIGIEYKGYPKKNLPGSITGELTRKYETLSKSNPAAAAKLKELIIAFNEVGHENQIPSELGKKLFGPLAGTSYSQMAKNSPDLVKGLSAETNSLLNSYVKNPAFLAMAAASGFIPNFNGKKVNANFYRTKTGPGDIFPEEGTGLSGTNARKPGERLYGYMLEEAWNNMVMSILGNNVFIPDASSVNPRLVGDVNEAAQRSAKSAALNLSSAGRTTSLGLGRGMSENFGNSRYVPNPDAVYTGKVSGKMKKVNYDRLSKVLGVFWSSNPETKSAWDFLKNYAESGKFVDKKEIKSRTGLLRKSYEDWLIKNSYIGTQVKLSDYRKRGEGVGAVNYAALRSDLAGVSNLQNLGEMEKLKKYKEQGIFYGDYKNNKAMYDKMGRWTYNAASKKMILNSASGFVPNFAYGTDIYKGYAFKDGRIYNDLYHSEAWDSIDGPTAGAIKYAYHNGKLLLQTNKAISPELKKNFISRGVPESAFSPVEDVDSMMRSKNTQEIKDKLKNLGSVQLSSGIQAILEKGYYSKFIKGNQFYKIPGGISPEELKVFGGAEGWIKWNEQNYGPLKWSSFAKGFVPNFADFIDVDTLTKNQVHYSGDLMKLIKDIESSIGRNLSSGELRFLSNPKTDLSKLNNPKVLNEFINSERKGGFAGFAKAFLPNFAYKQAVMGLEESMSGNKAIFDTKPFPHIRNSSQPTFSSAIADHGGLGNALSDSMRGQKAAGLMSGGYIPNFGRVDPNAAFGVGGLGALTQAETSQFNKLNTALHKLETDTTLTASQMKALKTSIRLEAKSLSNSTGVIDIVTETNKALGDSIRKNIAAQRASTNTIQSNNKKNNSSTSKGSSFGFRSSPLTMMIAPILGSAIASQAAYGDKKRYELTEKERMTQNLANTGVTSVSTGAAIGTMILPGWGTAIGGAVGGLIAFSEATKAAKLTIGELKEKISDTANKQTDLIKAYKTSVENLISISQSGGDSKEIDLARADLARSLYGITTSNLKNLIPTDGSPVDLKSLENAILEINRKADSQVSALSAAEKLSTGSKEVSMMDRIIQSLSETILNFTEDVSAAFVFLGDGIKTLMTSVLKDIPFSKTIEYLNKGFTGFFDYLTSGIDKIALIFMHITRKIALEAEVMLEGIKNLNPFRDPHEKAAAHNALYDKQMNQRVLDSEFNNAIQKINTKATLGKLNMFLASAGVMTEALGGANGETGKAIASLLAKGKELKGRVQSEMGTRTIRQFDMEKIIGEYMNAGGAKSIDFFEKFKGDEVIQNFAKRIASQPSARERDKEIEYMMSYVESNRNDLLEEASQLSAIFRKFSETGEFKGQYILTNFSKFVDGLSKLRENSKKLADGLGVGVLDFTRIRKNIEAAFIKFNNMMDLKQIDVEGIYERSKIGREEAIKRTEIFGKPFEAARQRFESERFNRQESFRRENIRSDVNLVSIAAGLNKTTNAGEPLLNLQNLSKNLEDTTIPFESRAQALENFIKNKNNFLNADNEQALRDIEKAKSVAAISKKKNEEDEKTANFVYSLEIKRLQEARSFNLQLRAGLSSLNDEGDLMVAKLGRDLPGMFADGMVNGIKAAIKESNNLSDALLGIAANFLDSISTTLMQAGTRKILGGFGFENLFTAQKGGAIRAQSGMYISGTGSGDKYPALLENGEYVLNRNAVMAMGGPAALDTLNFSAAPRFASGGSFGFDLASSRSDQDTVANMEKYMTSEGLDNSPLYKELSDAQKQKMEEDRKRRFAQRQQRAAMIGQLVAAAATIAIGAGVSNVRSNAQATKAQNLSAKLQTSAPLTQAESGSIRGLMDKGLLSPTGVYTGGVPQTGFKALFSGPSVGPTWYQRFGSTVSKPFRRQTGGLIGSRLSDTIPGYMEGGLYDSTIVKKYGTGMQGGGSSIMAAGNNSSTVNNNTNANNSFNFNTTVQRDGTIKMGANTTSYQQQDVELSKNLNAKMYAVVTEVIRKEKQFGGSLAGIRN